ncbi:thioesterase [Aliikangiella marina]|uniref:Thioesterase n=1 Tax=Aliikangiella marina TaxID=1712262 RepID=A0A545TJQ9_9GAMM|nr:thioesterase domain-containing protein [Aliikangiella marina]TQV77391.1 thioesterase [Aliikangiella marina]
MSKDQWLLRPNRSSPLNQDIKLLCFPYAGGSAATYLDWHNWLPQNVDLVAIQPPGRASRIFEPGYKNMHDLVDSLIEALYKELSSPYILFGHSLGSRIAFELMNRCLAQNLPLPHRFIASGSRGPHLSPRITSIYRLPDAQFIEKLKSINGTPKEILENSELMELCLPMLRSDFELADKYKYSGDCVFDCPVSIFGGKSDSEISVDELKTWQKFFSKDITIELFAGDHFFIDSCKTSVISKVNEIIKFELTNLQVVS